MRIRLAFRGHRDPISLSRSKVHNTSGFDWHGSVTRRLDLFAVLQRVARVSLRKRSAGAGSNLAQIRSHEFSKDHSTYAFSKALRGSSLPRPSLSSPISFNPRPVWRSWDTPPLGSLLSIACSRPGKNSGCIAPERPRNKAGGGCSTRRSALRQELGAKTGGDPSSWEGTGCQPTFRFF